MILFCDAHQSSLTRLCQSADRSHAAHRASDNALSDALPHVVLFTEWGVATYPVERNRHVGHCSSVEATFNHGKLSAQGLLGLPLAQRATVTFVPHLETLAFEYIVLRRAKILAIG